MAGGRGNPQSPRSPPQSDSAFGLGSSPKAARRTYLCFSVLCHLYLHSAHGQHHLGRPPTTVTPLSRLRTPTYPQQRRERGPFQAAICRQSPVGRALSSPGARSLASPSWTPGIVRNRAGRQQAQEAAEPGPEPCSLRLHPRRQTPGFTGQSEVRLGSPRPPSFPPSLYLRCLAIPGVIDRSPAT